MQTVNGKLINMERGQLDIVRCQTGEISKRCENLQQQLNSLQQANEDKNTACLQEINAVKSHLVMMKKKLMAVEEIAAKQAKSLTAVTFYSFWSLAFISVLLGMSIQMNWNKEQPQKHAEAAELSINCVRFGA